MRYVLRCVAAAFTRITHDFAFSCRLRTLLFSACHVIPHDRYATFVDYVYYGLITLLRGVTVTDVLRSR